MTARRYTEEQFRAAVADPDVRTMADLCRALGIVPRGGNYETLRRYGAACDLDVDETLLLRELGCTRTRLLNALAVHRDAAEVIDHLDLEDRHTVRRQLRRLVERLHAEHPVARPAATGTSGARRSYTDEQLAHALKHARNYPELCRALSLSPVSGTYRRLRRHAAELGMPLPKEWSRPGVYGSNGSRRSRGQRRLTARPQPSPEYDEDALRRAVAQARCLAEAIRSLGDEPTSGSYARLRRGIRRHRVDTSHFTREAQRGGRTRRPLDELLSTGKRVQSDGLRRRLIAEGIKEHRCEGCHATRWRDHAIPLELDHIDGDRRNNHLPNLRLLCPNCHALTPTYRGRNVGRIHERRTPEPGRSEGEERPA